MANEGAARIALGMSRVVLLQSVRLNLGFRNLFFEGGWGSSGACFVLCCTRDAENGWDGCGHSTRRGIARP